MTQFLIRRFIRHPNDPQDPATRTAYGNLASGVGMACNLLLCLGKLLAGTLYNGPVRVASHNDCYFFHAILLKKIKMQIKKG